MIEQVRQLRISDYDYPLPDERIARHPLEQREQCKLLCWRDGVIDDRHFVDVPQLLPSECMLVYNNTRVINARLRFTKETGARIEVFCLEPWAPRDYERIFQATDQCDWQCLVGNSKRWREGALTLQVPIDGRTVTLTAERGEAQAGGCVVHFAWDGGVTFATLLEAIGEIPIPPYLRRDSCERDRTDYQTVYSHIEGSVAAPTAGLHFTDALLEQCDAVGIVRRELTLHVGAGTFQPVKSEHIGDHAMHCEFIDVPRDLIDELRRHERTVIAVGTTSVRTLESLYYMGLMAHEQPEAHEFTVDQWMPYTVPASERPSTEQALTWLLEWLDKRGMSRLMGSTRLMIAPGFTYRLVDGMITNFHQPQSTLLLLVAAFTGADRWRAIYDHALASDYRFLSYGDATLLLPRGETSTK